MMEESNPLPSLDTKSELEIHKLKLQLFKASQEPVLSTTKRKRVILEEEEYTDRIESIIERDFYPDVTQLRFELEYQDALEKNDYDRLLILGKQRLEANHPTVPKDTPATFETPLTQDADFVCPVKLDPRDNSPTERAEHAKVDDMNLNSFLSKYTSEDNAAFEELQEEATRKHIEKFEFLQTDAKQHNEKIDNALTVPSIELQAAAKAGVSTGESGDMLISWKYKNANSVMFQPEGVPLSKEESAKLKAKQVVLHENTRFKSRPFSVIPRDSPLTPASTAPNLLKSGKIGVDGKEVSLSALPAVNGFKYVASTPTIAPENVPDSPLMTWGVIESTPLHIRGDATPLTRPNMTPGSMQFRIPDVPLREKAGQELANRLLTKRKKDKVHLSTGALKDGAYKSSLERLNSMSPAARLLATKRLGLHSAMDRSLQASYSPMMSSSFRSQTPTPRQIVTPSPDSRFAVSGTDKKNSLSAFPDSRLTYQQGSSSGKLRKRPKASEYF